MAKGKGRTPRARTGAAGGRGVKSRSRAAAATQVAVVRTGGGVRPHDLVEELSTSFLDYSMSVIGSRALPDARDGLKPSQRRVIVTMRDERLWPESPQKKCATVVGTALGRYHPHGDSSVYGTLVRMAQPWVMHEPLVDGQGNFGSIDGDAAAAYRYTEARLTAAAAALLEDIDADTVDMRPTFDGRHMEPVVLPARLPNLLLNGSEGIAVGMATRIPPHNLRELAAAIALLCDDPNAGDAALLGKVRGPDFPTGGQLTPSSEVRALYTTGRGRLWIRARAHSEVVASGRDALVVTELPYGVNKAELLIKIADLVKEGAKVNGGDDSHTWDNLVADLRDESNREGIRVIIECKGSVAPEELFEALCGKRLLEVTYGAQILALVDGVPKQLSLRGALEVFIAHRLDVIVRRSRHRLSVAEKRAHVVEGLLVAIRSIQRVVEIIRKAKDRQAAKAALCRTFKLTEIQADAILALRLSGLTALDVGELKQELAELKARIKELKALLASEKQQRAMVRDETAESAARFGRTRRTEIAGRQAAKSAPAIRRVERTRDVAWSSRGALVALDSSGRWPSRPAAGEVARGVLTFKPDSVATLITDNGTAYSMSASALPPVGGVAEMASCVSGMSGDEKVVWAGLPGEISQSDSLLFVLSTGLVKRTPIADYVSVRSGGVVGTVLRPEDELVAVFPVRDSDELLLVSYGGKGIRFSVSDIPVQGRASRGVVGMKLASGDRTVGAAVVGREIALLTSGGHGKRVSTDEFPLQKRGGQGVLLAARLSEAAGGVIGVWDTRSTAAASGVGPGGREDSVLVPAGDMEAADRPGAMRPVSRMVSLAERGPIRAVVPAVGR